MDRFEQGVRRLLYTDGWFGTTIVLCMADFDSFDVPPMTGHLPCVDNVGLDAALFYGGRTGVVTAMLCRFAGPDSPASPGTFCASSPSYSVPSPGSDFDSVVS